MFFKVMVTVIEGDCERWREVTGVKQQCEGDVRSAWKQLEGRARMDDDGSI